MFVLTEKGQLVEGEPLTPAEKTLVEDILEGNEINSNGVYLTQSGRIAVVVYLIKNFIVYYRNPPIKTMSEPAPISFITDLCAEALPAPPAPTLDENA